MNSIQCFYIWIRHTFIRTPQIWQMSLSFYKAWNDMWFNCTSNSHLFICSYNTYKSTVNNLCPIIYIALHALHVQKFNLISYIQEKKQNPLLSVTENIYNHLLHIEKRYTYWQWTMLSHMTIKISQESRSWMTKVYKANM